MAKVNMKYYEKMLDVDISEYEFKTVFPIHKIKYDMTDTVNKYYRLDSIIKACEMTLEGKKSNSFLAAWCIRYAELLTAGEEGDWYLYLDSIQNAVFEDGILWTLNLLPSMADNDEVISNTLERFRLFDDIFYHQEKYKVYLTELDEEDDDEDDDKYYEILMYDEESKRYWHEEIVLDVESTGDLVSRREFDEVLKKYGIED